MRTKILDTHGGKTYAVVFDKGDEVVSGLTSLAKREGWAGSHLTAIGAFSDVTLGYFDRQRKD
jgi:predicted DNA-binding protein with PD1-like motif